MTEDYWDCQKYFESNKKNFRTLELLEVNR